MKLKFNSRINLNYFIIQWFCKYNLTDKPHRINLNKGEDDFK